VHGKLFTSVYMDGVKEFMRYVKEKFNDNLKFCARAVMPQSEVPKSVCCEQTLADECHGH
jgi:hypothetical protein